MILYTPKRFSQINSVFSSLRTGLVSAWMLNEASGTLVDQVNGNNGTGAGITYNVDGLTGKGITIDGANDHGIDCGTPSNLQLGLTGAIACSFKANNFNGGNTLVSMFNWDTDRSGFSLFFSGGSPGKLAFELCSASGASANNNATVLKTGVEYRAMITWDATVMYFYLNGEFDGSGGHGTTPSYAGFKFVIGASTNTSNNLRGVHNGYISRLNTWNVTLTAAQAKADYIRPYPFI